MPLATRLITSHGRAPFTATFPCYWTSVGTVTASAVTAPARAVPRRSFRTAPTRNPGLPSTRESLSRQLAPTPARNLLEDALDLGWWLPVVVGLGALEHSAADVLNVEGVPPFWPFHAAGRPVWRLRLPLVGATDHWRERLVFGPPSTSNGALKRAASPSAHRTRGPFGLADSAPASGRARTGRAIRNPSGCRVGDAPGHRDKAHPVRHQHL